MVVELVPDEWVDPEPADGRIYGRSTPTSELTLVEPPVTAPTRAERRARLLDTAHRVRPVVLAEEQRLPVVERLAPLLPEGLRRGTTVGVVGPGSRTLLFSLAAESTRTGSWLVLVGMPEAGLAAAVEQGVALERVALVDAPPPTEWSTVVGALIGTVDLVAVAPTHRLRPGDVRRLRARARERGSVVIQVGEAARWPRRHDLQLSVEASRWTGLSDGHGHLERREVAIERVAARRPPVTVTVPL